MRIFQILGATTNAAVPGNRVWLRYLHESLIEMGHDVVLFPTDEGRRAMVTDDAGLRADYSHLLAEAFREEHARRPVDLVFAYLMDGMVEPAAIDEIRAVGVPACNFSCNNIHQFHLRILPNKRQGITR